MWSDDERDIVTETYLVIALIFIVFFIGLLIYFFVCLKYLKIYAFLESIAYGFQFLASGMNFRE